MKLNKYDYELLDFLYHNNNSDLQEILNTFPENVGSVSPYTSRYRSNWHKQKDLNLYL